MKSFLAGLGIGIGLGILFAPMSGEDARENLSQRASDLADSARDMVDQGRERVRSTVSTFRGQAERAVNNVASNLKDATGTDLRNL
ncbi:MAG TPA: YtxH domain-containing protein [Candidatus Angelobacter sp.]|jgi:gas vesicle protein